MVKSTRRNGRIMAVQGLYSYDVGKIPLAEILKLEWIQDNEDSALLGDVKLEQEEDLQISEESADFARLLISGTINHLEEIDGLITSHLSGSWSFDRLNKVTLAILRISIFALIYQKDLAPNIVIDEAISISKDFGAEDSFKFINAILDRISKGQ